MGIMMGGEYRQNRFSGFPDINLRDILRLNHANDFSILSDSSTLADRIELFKNFF
jgi:hypothetical protein